MPTTARPTSRTAVDPWLGLGRSVCVVQSRRVERSAVAEAVASSPFHSSMVRAGRSMADELTAANPDVVIIDATTGDFDAVRLCRDVHSSAGVPIIAVAPKAAARDDAAVIDLLDAGASDVITAGASPERLLAHVRAALRSSPPRQAPASLVVVGDVVIDLDAHVLTIDGRVVNCPPLLFSMLAALASAPNKVATRESLLTRVWGVEPGTVDTRRVRVAASLLRRVLGAGPRRPRLETVSRVGYRLAVD